MKKRIQIQVILFVIAALFVPSSTVLAIMPSPFVGHWVAVGEFGGGD